jgi:hypothetical protein
MVFGFWHRVDSSVDNNVYSVLKMETVCFSEKLASTKETTRRQNPKNIIIKNF